MQKVLLTSTFLCWTLINLFGQKNPTKIYGTVPIDNVLSMDATEVTINEWIHFIINNNFSADFFPNSSSISNSTSLLFDDLKKGKDFEYIEIINNSIPLKENYGNKGFRITRKFKKLTEADTNYFSINIPIVGISFAQAKAFCEWRENVVNKYRAVKVKISLPTIEVYEKVIENKDSINPKNCYLQNSLNCNCLVVKKTKEYKSQGNCLMRADAYWPSLLGLYCLQGNASEMTDTEGIAMGGSFRDYARQSLKDKKQTYSKPEDWLGFRCLVTLK
jgi:formylglycine-generating enzyme required for sulfatase activity